MWQAWQEGLSRALGVAKEAYRLRGVSVELARTHAVSLLASLNPAGFSPGSERQFLFTTRDVRSFPALPQSTAICQRPSVASASIIHRQVPPHRLAAITVCAPAVASSSGPPVAGFRSLADNEIEICFNGLGDEIAWLDVRTYPVSIRIVHTYRRPPPEDGGGRRVLL
jgi:hypothetical protein